MHESNYLLKIIDYGFTQKIDEAYEQPAFGGAPCCSPEAEDWKKKKLYTTKADIWNLGVAYQ